VKRTTDRANAALSTLREELEELDSRLDEADTEIELLKQEHEVEMQSLEKALGEANERADSYLEDLEHKDNEIYDIKDMVHDLESQIAQLQNDLAEAYLTGEKYDKGE
jgi:chromosome segregation ATPase